MTDIQDIIGKNVSYQPNAWSSIEGEVSIGTLIKGIKNGKLKNEVDLLRSFLKSDDKEKYDSYKKRLPAVTFCGLFEGGRRKELIKEYHKILVIDIDKLSDDDFTKIKTDLNEDQYIFTFWVSPSESGFKGLIHLDFDFDIAIYGIDASHKMAFDQIAKYFKETYSIELDLSGSDTTRLCFLSFDPNLVFKSEINSFPVKEIKASEEKVDRPKGAKKESKTITIASKKLLNNPKGKNNQINKRAMLKILGYLTKNKTSITNTYDEWYRVAYAIANTFTHDLGEKYYLTLCELDGEKHNEIESRNMLLYCYLNSNGSINFNTIVFMAKKKGFKN